jgi:hypothetical protein
MSQENWVKKYAAMDKRIIVKYEQLPKGEQIGKKPAPPRQEASKSP